MLLRAWDGEKFRYDFVVTAIGKVLSPDESGVLMEVDWEVTEAICGIRANGDNRVFYGDVISNGPYKYAIRNKIYKESGNQWSGPGSRTVGVGLPLGSFEIIGNKWQTPGIWKDAIGID